MDILNMLDASTLLAMNTPDQSSLPALDTPSLDSGLSAVDLSIVDLNPSLPLTDGGQHPVDLNPPSIGWNEPLSFDAPPTDWTQPQIDWGTASSIDLNSSLLSHDHSLMPRSAGDAEVASGWADWHQANADKAKEWATWDVEHNPENLTHHVKEAEEEQAKANAKRQEALDELNK